VSRNPKSFLPTRTPRESIITPERDGKRLRDLDGELIPDLEALRGEKGEVIWGRSFKWPLDFYFRRKHINGAQHRAGCDYHRLWRDGVINSGYAQVRYEVRAGGNTTPTPSLRTEVEYKQAVEAITGATEDITTMKRYVIYMVCALGVSAGRGNIVMLRDGLNDLYNHFRRIKDGFYECSKEGD
jgi:hypothetical protein